MEAPSSLTLDREIRVPGIFAQMRTYRWPRAFESVEATHGQTAILTLSRQPPSTNGRFCAGKGSGRFVEIGGVSFAPAQIPMEWRTEGGSLQLLCCELDRDRFRSLTVDERWTGAELEASLDIRSGELERILLALARELTTPGFATPILMEALGMELMVGLSRYFQRIRADGAARPGRGGGALPLRRLADYIDSLPGPAPSLDELARLCGVSRGYLMRAFKAQTGKTVHAYVAGIRYRKAQTLLADTTLPLKEIAFRLGFSSAANFSTAFRKSGGEAPFAFRRRSRPL